MPAPGSIDTEVLCDSTPPTTRGHNSPDRHDGGIPATECAAGFDRPEIDFDAASESVVADYFGALGAPSLSGVSAVVRHPRHTFSALAAIRRLPLLKARPTGSTEGAIVLAGLLRQQQLVRAAVSGLTAVLVLPNRIGEFAQGPGKSTKGVRNRINSARRSGITWRAIDSAVERQQLVELADAFERSNPREAYRHEDANNADLLDVDLWLLASAANGTPLLLAVLAVDGEWAVQRYFRTVTHSDEASLSRWLMVQVAVDALVERGVRYLADTSSPITLEPGLRYFQRLVGFRLYRVKVER